MGWLDRFRQKTKGQGSLRARMAYPDRAVRANWTLSNSEVIYSAVSRICNTFSMVPVGLYEGLNRAAGSRVDDLLSISPNDNMVPIEFFRAIEADRLTTGNGYALIIRGEDGQPLKLIPVDSSRVTPRINTDNGELWYMVNMAQLGQPLVHNTDMIHVRMLSADGISGISPMGVLSGTLNYSASVSKFSLQHLENGVHSGMVVEFPAEISEVKRLKAIKQLLDIYKESGGALIALDAGIRATKMDGSMIDPKLLDVDKITRLRVAAVYNMPPHMLGDYSNSSYTSQEQESLEFVTMTMMPIVETYRQEFNRKLVSAAALRAGWSTKWDLRVLEQMDGNTRSEMYFKGVRSALATPNEYRKRQGDPPMPGGDELYVSRDMIALRDLPNLKTARGGGYE